MFVDSHCHLNLLDGDLPLILSQAQQSGVDYFLCAGLTLTDQDELIAMAERYPQVFIGVGLHPNENPGFSVDKAELLALASHPKVVAIGETGLDYFRSQGDITWQQERFATHIACAREVKKPLIVHTRDAKADTLAMLRQHRAEEIGGVIHCFTEDWEMAQQAIDLGFYISFSGIVTFKNAVQLQEVAQKMPLEKMLIETDSPYLAPIPHRGKPNVPAFVSHVAEAIATLRNEPLEKIAKQTTENFFQLFSAARMLSAL